MLHTNREKIQEIITKQRHLREQMEAIWEEEETHNFQRANAHEYNKEEIAQTDDEEIDMEWTSNLMDNVLDKLYECIGRDKSAPKFTDNGPI